MQHSKSTVGISIEAVYSRHTQIEGIKTILAAVVFLAVTSIVFALTIQLLAR